MATQPVEPTACAQCYRSHRKCDKKRPCGPCIRYRKSCTDNVHKRRGRPPKNPNAPPKPTRRKKKKPRASGSPVKQGKGRGRGRPRSAAATTTTTLNASAPAGIVGPHLRGSVPPQPPKPPPPRLYTPHASQPAPDGQVQHRRSEGEAALLAAALAAQAALGRDSPTSGMQSSTLPTSSASSSSSSGFIDATYHPGMFQSIQASQPHPGSMHSAATLDPFQQPVPRSGVPYHHHHHHQQEGQLPQHGQSYHGQGKQQPQPQHQQHQQEPRVQQPHGSMFRGAHANGGANPVPGRSLPIGSVPNDTSASPYLANDFMELLAGSSRVSISSPAFGRSSLGFRASLPSVADSIPSQATIMERIAHLKTEVTKCGSCNHSVSPGDAVCAGCGSATTQPLVHANDVLTRRSLVEHLCSEIQVLKRHNTLLTQLLQPYLGADGKPLDGDRPQDALVLAPIGSSSPRGASYTSSGTSASPSPSAVDAATAAAAAARATAQSPSDRRSTLPSLSEALGSTSASPSDSRNTSWSDVRVGLQSGTDGSAMTPPSGGAPSALASSQCYMSGGPRHQPHWPFWIMIQCENMEPVMQGKDANVGAHMLITSISDNLLTLIGYAKTEVEGKYLDAFLPDVYRSGRAPALQRFVSKVRMATNGDLQVRGVTMMNHADGKTVVAWDYASLLFCDKSGNPVVFFQHAFNIRLCRTEAQIRAVDLSTLDIVSVRSPVVNSGRPVPFDEEYFPYAEDVEPELPPKEELGRNTHHSSQQQQQQATSQALPHSQ